MMFSFRKFLAESSYMPTPWECYNNELLDRLKMRYRFHRGAINPFEVDFVVGTVKGLWRWAPGKWEVQVESEILKSDVPQCRWSQLVARQGDHDLFWISFHDTLRLDDDISNLSSVVKRFDAHAAATVDFFKKDLLAYQLAAILGQGQDGHASDKLSLFMYLNKDVLSDKAWRSELLAYDQRAWNKLLQEAVKGRFISRLIADKFKLDLLDSDSLEVPDDV